MSLALAAQHLATKGRHGDSMLVHMTPSEVAGLQALAHAHGQTLTINPETGLPEAFSLKSLLPMLGGAALTALSGGALSPLMAAGIMGGGTALATGSLQKGLMAGLGAYGGAGIGGALAGAGAAGANAAATNSILQANPGLTAGEIGREMGTAGFVQPQLAANMNPATMSMTDKLVGGFKGLGTEAGRSAVMEQMGGLKGLAKYGGAALSPVLMAESGQTGRAPSSGPNPYNFTFDPGRTGAGPSMNSSESLYFRPRYLGMAEGGSTGMTGQSDAYYRYLMGLAPAPIAQTISTTNATADAAPVMPTYQAITNPLAAVQASAGNRDPYYDNSLSGEQPIPGNPDFMFDPTTGQLTPVVDALASVGNALGINSPQQGVISGLPGLIMGNPLGMLFGAAVGNAVQGQGMVNAHNSMIAANGGYSIPGTLSPGQAGFYAAPHLSAYSLGTDLSTLPSGGALVLGDIQAGQTPVGGEGLHANTVGAGGVPGGIGLNANSTGIGLTTNGANPGFLANYGYTPIDPTLGLPPVYDVVPSPNGPAAGPTGADNEDAGIGAAVAAAAAAAEANNAAAVAESNGNPDSAPGGGGDAAAGAAAGADAGGIGGDLARGGLAGLAAFANGGYNLGGYSDGGRLLRGPGDGVSDSIPATIADKRPARLADGEFVVPARIVSELGNGSTEAGARQLYAMMDRIQNARQKTVGKGKVAVNSRASKLLPA